MSKESAILIIGAGVFGLSTALELTQRGYQNVTVLDRYLPPVQDGSSVDISRIIRADYADDVYARIASEAMELWKTKHSHAFHPTNFVMFSETTDNPYMIKTKENLSHHGIPFEVIAGNEDVQRTNPSLKAAGGDYSKLNGYTNPVGGWANAAGAVQALARECSLAGVSFIVGKRGTVTSLRIEEGKIVGVNVAAGPWIAASKVILSAGAWSCRLVDLSKNSISTGQPVGFIQLTDEEAAELADLPVIINMSTGWFCFPPDPVTKQLKCARHGFGYTTEVAPDYGMAQDGQSKVSAPPRDKSSSVYSFIPADAETALRTGLRQFYPKLADRPWSNTRLCWYTDTPTGDFIIDEHPRLENLFLATGGAGHGFKFMPVLGKYIADCFENKASQEMREKWRFRPVESVDMRGDGSRGGPDRRPLTAVEVARL
ncbi:FAD dependent oxidoreductase-5 [Coleophoma cylindrospora]|uniref:FAD dependent oxidoreductase-5 n=1 Tax=Coleophoma cylindrospora TaxID=1849047 RepID=A0A3D8R0M1_9HELO|nr:FAD dependent oxidoreductase-5 [Coleophoma cylindrospora]